MEPQLSCPNCKQNIPESYYFCPNCGKQLKAKPLSASILKQIGIYLLSFLLPPLGLWPGIKYLRQPNGEGKMVGFVAILLTVISIVLSVWITAAYMDSYGKMLNSLSNGTFRSF